MGKVLAMPYASRVEVCSPIYPAETNLLAIRMADNSLATDGVLSAIGLLLNAPNHGKAISLPFKLSAALLLATYISTTTALLVCTAATVRCISTIPSDTPFSEEFVVYAGAALTFAAPPFIHQTNATR